MSSVIFHDYQTMHGSILINYLIFRISFMVSLYIIVVEINCDLILESQPSVTFGISINTDFKINIEATVVPLCYIVAMPDIL